MSQDTLAWVQGAEGRGILMALHIAGMMLLSCSIIGSFVMAVRMLFWRGPRPGHTFVGLVHGSLALALVVVWASGGGLVLGGDVLNQWPDQLTVKLGVAGALTMSIWIAHVVVPPLLHSRRRPLVDALGWRGQLALIVTQSVSLSCWAMLIAYSFSEVARGMALVHALLLPGGVAAALAIVWLLVAFAARSARAEARPRGMGRAKGRRRAPAEPPAQPRFLRQQPTAQPVLREVVHVEPPPMVVRAVAHPPPAEAQVRQVVPMPVAAPPPVAAPQPMPVVQHAQVSPAEELQQLRDKLAEEWFRCARMPEDHPAATDIPPAERQRLVQDWLRRPLQR